MADNHLGHARGLTGHASISVTLDAHIRVVEGKRDGLSEAMYGAL